MSRIQVDLEPISEIEGAFLRTRSMSRDQYRALCEANPDLRIERLASGEVIIMPPAHTRAGAQCAELVFQLKLWAKADGTGIATDSSAGYDLPNGSNRAPDASWFRRTRLAALSEEERDEFLPFSPDFVAEVRSKSDRLKDLRGKMIEYIENGSRLGWLIDPRERKVYVYRPGAPVEEMSEPKQVSGDPELPGFVLDLEAIWSPF